MSILVLFSPILEPFLSLIGTRRSCPMSRIFSARAFFCDRGVVETLRDLLPQTVPLVGPFPFHLTCGRRDPVTAAMACSKAAPPQGFEVLLSTRGAWARNGRKVEELVIDASGHVRFAGGNPTGLGLKLADGAHTFVFDDYEWESEGKLTAYVMYEVYPGFWRSSGNTCVYIPYVSNQVEPPKPTTLQNLQIPEHTKHMMLWFHPGRRVQYLYLLKDTRIIWSNGRGEMSPPGGLHSYSPGSEGHDLWLIRFHYKGEEAREEQTVLRHMTDHEGNLLPSPCWRAAGVPNDWNLPNDWKPLNPHKMTSWHIIMLKYPDELLANV